MIREAVAESESETKSEIRLYNQSSKLDRLARARNQRTSNDPEFAAVLAAGRAATSRLAFHNGREIKPHSFPNRTLVPDLRIVIANSSQINRICTAALYTRCLSPPPHFHPSYPSSIDLSSTPTTTTSIDYFIDKASCFISSSPTSSLLPLLSQHDWT